MLVMMELRCHGVVRWLLEPSFVYVLRKALQSTIHTHSKFVLFFSIASELSELLLKTRTNTLHEEKFIVMLKN